MLDERFFFGWEDVDLCVRAARKGFKVLFVPESRIWHKGFGIDKRDRLMGMPVYYATRGQFLFMEKHFAKPQLAVAWLYFVVTFPGCVWVYSRILHQWKVPLYILWGIGGYLRIKFREYTKI
jgi:GT2 family glycosyltransferase